MRADLLKLARQFSHHRSFRYSPFFRFALMFLAENPSGFVPNLTLLPHTPRSDDAHKLQLLRSSCCGILPEFIRSIIHALKKQ